MPFPISLNGRLELKIGDAKPERLHDIIVSSLNSMEGCSVRTDNLTTFFTCAWSFRRGRGDLADFSNGKIRLNPKDSSVVVEYKLSLIQSFVMGVLLGGLLFFSIGVNIKNEMTPSPIVPPILFLLWWLIYIADYIQKGMKMHRFLKRCARDAGEQDAK